MPTDKQRPCYTRGQHKPLPTGSRRPASVETIKRVSSCRLCSKGVDETKYQCRGQELRALGPGSLFHPAQPGCAEPVRQAAPVCDRSRTQSHRLQTRMHRPSRELVHLRSVSEVGCRLAGCMLPLLLLHRIYVMRVQLV